jgi:hypothetical protein
MDAVTFMDSMKQPRDASAPPPQRPQRRVSPNMALFATIGVLLLAMGVGVLIGRSGNHTVASAPQQAPIVIKGNGTQESGTTANEGASSTATSGGDSKKQSAKTLKAEANSGNGANEFLKPAKGYKPPKATAQPGETCVKETAGCTNGKFTGNYFE